MNKLLIALGVLGLLCLAGGLALAQAPPPDPPGDPWRVGAPVLIVQADGGTVAGQVALCWVPLSLGGKGGPDLAQPAAPTATPTPTPGPPPGRDPTRTPRGGPPRTATRIVVQLTTTVVQAISPTPGPPWGP